MRCIEMCRRDRICRGNRHLNRYMRCIEIEESRSPYTEKDKYYDERSDRSKVEPDKDIDEIVKKAFPSLYADK